jgi:signal transduction histidine kinase
VLALSGWAAAGVAGAVAVTIWRMLAGRMETVVRACHELRGPITAARLGVALGVRGGELTPERLRAIELELGRASLAIDDLARARDARLPRSAIEEVEVAALLADLIEGARAAAASAGREVVSRWSGPPAVVAGDRLRLAQAIGNLLANALEHGSGLVEVQGRRDGAGVRIEVSDEGAGLPAPVAELARRAHRGRGSRGRGLAIALEIASRHGGRLAATPSEHGGRVVLELPCAVSAGPARAGHRRL